MNHFLCVSSGQWTQATHVHVVTERCLYYFISTFYFVVTITFLPDTGKFIFI
jgi:hypothetical protein